MTQFLCDVMDSDFCSSEFEKNFCNPYNNLNNLMTEFDSVIETTLLEDSVHSVFNEIAHIRPTSSSSSDEDDKNLIMSWELNEKNLDTLPSNPICQIKQESEELFISDSDTGQVMSPSQSLCSISIIETPPVSPDVKSVSSSNPVNIVLIDSTHHNVLPLQPVNNNGGARLVPVTPLRSQKRDLVKNVPSSAKNTKPNITSPYEQDNKNFKKVSPSSSCDNVSWLLPKTESSPVVTSLSDSQIKAIKRQQRMIKNRESASLSRKKKKEYVTYLEQRLNELTKENNYLKEENKKFKNQLEQYERINEWHSPSKLFDKTKKITAVFAVMFMISFNVSTFRNFPAKASDELSEDVIFNYNEGESHLSRSLLWADDDLHKSSENISKSEFKRRGNISNEKCPLHINQTESLSTSESKL